MSMIEKLDHGLKVVHTQMCFFRASISLNSDYEKPRKRKDYITKVAFRVHRTLTPQPGLE